MANGTPMPHPYETQRMGENGPLLLQDLHLIDLLSHFDREGNTEGAVHAKGAVPTVYTRPPTLSMTYVSQTCSNKARNAQSLFDSPPSVVSPDPTTALVIYEPYL